MREEVNTRTALTSKNSYDQGILPWGRLKVLDRDICFPKTERQALDTKRHVCGGESLDLTHAEQTLLHGGILPINPAMHFLNKKHKTGSREDLPFQIEEFGTYLETEENAGHI